MHPTAATTIAWTVIVAAVLITGAVQVIITRRRQRRIRQQWRERSRNWPPGT